MSARSKKSSKSAEVTILMLATAPVLAMIVVLFKG
jgi:hypothetical protein